MELVERHSKTRALSLHSLRVRLAGPDALPELTLLGLITGVLAGGLLIGFRESITFISNNSLLPSDETFVALDSLMRFFLPVVGACIILLLVKLLPVNCRSFGIGHVIDRVHFHHGSLPGLNVVGQFIGALIALLSGFSVGREGPAVHMGAGAGSLLGQKLRLPDNSLPTLAGCGTAAAISASFNTPMAGVIFAMEVVMREYSIGSFIPLMAASVVASLISQVVYGPDPAFIIPLVPMVSFYELGITVLSAVCIGVLAAVFIRISVWTASNRQGMFIRPLLMGGVIMGVAGAFVPDVMGIGYNTVSSILGGDTFSVSYLWALVLLKLIITALVIGLGIPGGAIGPSLFIGAGVGAVLSSLGARYFSLPADDVYHALVGMVAMMAAVLQAPLAALMTVLEMTRNPHIIMPAMLAIIIACLIANQLFKQQNLFVMQLKAGGQVLDQHPLYDALGKIGVARLLTASFELSPRYLARQKFQALCYQAPEWVVFEDNHKSLWAISWPILREVVKGGPEDEPIDLLNIGKARIMRAIDFQASLDDALKTMNKYCVDMLYVRSAWRERDLIVGVLTRADIEDFYS